jgi:hypothetical protein
LKNEERVSIRSFSKIEEKEEGNKPPRSKIINPPQSTAPHGPGNRKN